MSAAAALVWAKGVVGEVSARPIASRPFAQGQVFELQGAEGRYALKCHHSAAGFHQERDAYERWTSALTHSAPALRAASEPHQALLLPWVDGVDGDAAHLTATERRSGLFAAGQLIARLQTCAVVDDDSMDLGEAVSLRVARWRDGAARRLSDDRLTWAAKVVDPALFQGLRRRPAHRDLQPRNWVHADGEVQFLDWAHARLDAPLTDWVKLACGEARRLAGGFDALQRGFGRPLSAQEGERLFHLCALHGLATTAWAGRHGDAEAQREGLATLEWLRALGPAGFSRLL